MAPAPGRSWLSLLWALAWLLPTAWLFTQQQAQRIDPTNQALKAPGTADATNQRDLATVLASDQVVLLGFRVLGGLPVLPADGERVAAFRTALEAQPGVAGCRAPETQEQGLCLLTVSLQGDDSAGTAHAVVAAARKACPESMQLLATGLPLLEAAIADLVVTERRTIVPVLAFVLFAAAWVLYRRASLAVAALLPALLAIVWTSGLAAALGHPLDPVAALLDPVLLTIGVATSVHFVECWRRGLGSGLDPRGAARHAAAEQRTPTLLATGTTMVGLLSMATSPVPAVVDFGLWSAFGVALVHAFTFALLPGWLGWLRPAPVAAAATSEYVAARWLHGLLRNRATIVGVAVAATALAVARLPALRADNDPLALLPAEVPCRADHDALAAQLGGVEVCHLYAPPRSPATDPARLLSFVASTQLLPGVAGLGGPVLRGADGALAVPLLLRPGGTAVRQPLFAELARGARVLGLDGLVPAGTAVRIANDSGALMQSLVGSTALTLLLLVAGMCAGLRSWRLGLCGMLPNLLPCLWLYGAIAWAGRPVSVATGMIGCTMLGLVVDNTLHLLHQYRLLRAAAPPRAAMTAALQRVGRPMWLSSGLLVLGFATAATSRLATTIEFSLLACATILAALVGTGVLLPLLLVREDRHLHLPSGASHAL